jgi:syntaxin 17
MNEFPRLREQGAAFSLQDDNNDSEQDSTSNELRQRHTTTNRLNDSYDFLEQDLAHLREAVDEVAALVAQQKQSLSRTEHLRNLAQYPIQNASSIFQKAIHNRYVTLASGALLGASIGGPVGFVMGVKVGALVALSGSAVGALSMNIMQQRVSEASESQDNTTSYHQAML